jgi:hypothetical protein
LVVWEGGCEREDIRVVFAAGRRYGKGNQTGVGPKGPRFWLLRAGRETVEAEGGVLDEHFDTEVNGHHAH